MTIHGEEQTINRDQIVGFKKIQIAEEKYIVSIQYTGGLINTEITVKQYEQILQWLITRNIYDPDVVTINKEIQQ